MTEIHAPERMDDGKFAWVRTLPKGVRPLAVKANSGGTKLYLVRRETKEN